MYHLETKIESQGENITLNGTANAKFEKFVIGGNSSQETREEFKSTVKGTEVTVNDTYINNQTKFNIDGNSYQETTKGYQLLNVPAEYTVLSTENNKEVPISLKANTKYTIKIGSINTDNTDVTKVLFRFRYKKADISNPYAYVKLSDLKLVYTPASDVDAVWIYSSNGYVESSKTNTTYKNLMIYEGTDDKSYEPYTGGIPSPFPDYPQKITNVGGYDNLFDKNNIISGSYVSDSNGAFVSNSTSKRTDYIEIQANSYYHIYSDKTTGNWGAWYDKDKKFISGITLGGQKEGTVNSPTNAKYIAFTVSYQGNLTDYSNIKINETAIKIKQSGKNLLNVPAEYTVLSTENNKEVPISLKANTKYTIKIGSINTDNTDVTKVLFRFRYKKADISNPYAYVKLSDLKLVYTPASDVDAVWIYSGNGYVESSKTNTTYKNLMIYEGIEDASYEPYHEPIITPINLQGNILSKVGDVKDVLKINRNGEVKIKKNTWEETINTSDLITLPNNNKGLVLTTSKKKPTNYGNNDYLVTNAQRNRTFNDGTVYQNPSNFVFVGSSTDTLETIKAKFNGGKILYQLAAPQIISLPSISPIELWQGTNIFSLVTNLDTEIELEYNYIPQSPSPEAPSEIKNVKDNINIKIADKNNEEQQEILFPLVQGQKLMQGDYLADDGIHHVRGQVVLNGTETWWENTNYTTEQMLVANIILTGMKTGTTNIISSIAKYANPTVINSIRAMGTVVGIGLDKTQFPTVSSFTTWLSTHNTIVEYELEQEVIVPYTSAQQEVYNQIKQALSYEEQTNIFSPAEISPMFDVSAYKGISEEFKQRLLNGKITRAYLKVLATDTKPEMIIDENNYLKDCTFEELRYVPDEGFIGGTVAKRVTGNFNNVNSSFSIQDREFELYLGVDLEDGTTEYIKYGTFIVQKPEDDQVTDNTSFEALDYMTKLNLPWVDRMTYPCTLKELFDDLVAQSGLSTKVTSFLNQDFIVENNQFEEGTTRREVLKAIAQIAFNWARIDEDNDIVMDFEKKDEVAETLTADNYYNLKKQDKYGPINVIVLRNSQVEGENVTLKDEYSINYPIGKNYCPDIEKWELTNGTYIKDGYIVLPNSNSQAKIIFIKPEDVDNELYLNYISNSDESNYGTHVSIDYLDENKKIINSNENAHRNLNGENNIKANFGGNNEYGNAIKEAKYIRITFIKGSTYTPLPYKIKNVMLNKSDINYEPFIPNGETELVISDNPFAYTQSKRAKLIEAGRILFGLTYVPMSMDMIGYMYLNCKDKIKATNLNNETFETYLLNHTIEYTGTISDSMEAPAVTKTETKYQFTPQMIEALKHTELLVDKANQKINAAIEDIGQYDEKIANLELSVDGLDSKVSSLVDYERTTTGINELHLTETIEGDRQVTKFTIKGDSKNFIYLVPSNTLVPSNSLVPLGGRFNIVVDKQSRTEISEDAQIQEIYMDEPLRSYLGIYDELNITEGRITVTRRIGIDEYANLYILDEEVIEDYGEMFIKTFKDDTYIYIKEYYNLEYHADYLVSGELITKKNLGTELKQNAESIQVAWNQISQYVKIEGIDEKATFNIYNENNNILMKTNQDGQTFYDDYGNELGSIGVVRDKDKDVLAFSMPVNWESIDTSRSMAWGIVGPDKKFLPIFYLAGYYGEESSEYGGELQVEGILSVGQLNVTENLNLESMIGLYWGDEKYIQPILNASDQNREWISYRAPYGHEFAVGNNYFRIRENDMSFVINGTEYINILGNDEHIWIKKPLFVAYNNSTNEGHRGYPLIGISTGHRYFINWDGANLAFYVDNTYVGVLSDKRLKKDFKEIDDNVLKAIDELKIQEFKVINRNGKISFGIIAQDLIDSFKKYKINFEDYEIINSVQYDLNNKTLYYTVEYTQFLILKQLANDKKIEELQKKDKEKDLIIQDLISRIEKLEGGNV